MSDTSQGPDWWMASDGKWYAPELHPDHLASSPAPPLDATPNVTQQPPASPPAYMPPASSQPPPAFTPMVNMGVPQNKKTNGMAVASLVLGIVWAAGIGSLLAVIFGFISRKKIEESQGQQSGGGLAIAGIVLGFVGIAGAIGFWLLILAFGAAVDAGGSYANGYDYANSHYSANSSESSVCNSSNVPSGDISASWIDGCRDAWNLQGDVSGNIGNGTTSGNTGNTGSGSTSGNTGNSGNSGNTGIGTTSGNTGNTGNGTTATTSGNSG